MKKITGLLLAAATMMLLVSCKDQTDGMIMTVNGPVPPSEMGITLTHEHVLVDFIGADYINYKRWDKKIVAEKALPFLLEAKELGTRTFIECTPEYIGRDPELLKILSESTGMKFITNTGYYGAANDKYIPKHAYDESADELSVRWIREWERGIEGTGVRPGFIKTGVMDGDLSDLHRKIITAAARTHLATGLTIASHTGPAVPAFAQLGVLYEEGVAPEAFIWIHAQTEKDSACHVIAAQLGAWVSFDGLNEDNTGEYIRRVKNMKENNLLHKVLLSHDAGWYSPGKEEGGEYRGYSTLFKKLLPQLKAEGFTESEINQLLVTNPAEAFTIGVHKVHE